MLNNTKILIADEDLRSRRSIKDALVKNGYRFVEEAENGEEAILLINRIHPDVVIDRKSTRLNSSHTDSSRMPSSA